MEHTGQANGERGLRALGRRWLGFGMLVLLMTASAPPAAPAGTLALRIVDEAGESIPGAEARLLPFRWRKSRLDPIPATPEGSWSSLAIDPEAWQRSTGFEGLSVRLEVESEGYALLRSDVIARVTSEGGEVYYEIGFHDRGSGDRGAGKRETLRVPETGVLEASLVLRPAGERVLEFVESDGQAAVGVPVTVYAFGNRANACAQLSQSRRLAHGVTDASGRLPVPDVDSTYAIEIGSARNHRRSGAAADAASLAPPRWSIFEPEDPMQPQRRLAEPGDLDSPIRLHRWRPRPLRIEVTRGQQPMPEIAVGAVVRGSCGARGGPLGRADGEGVFEQTDAFVERYTELFLYDGEEGALWQIDTRDLPATGRVRVDLP